MRKSANKPKGSAPTRRKPARGHREPAEKLELIRAENSTETALERDLRGRKPR